MTVRRLTEHELKALRTDMQEASMWMKTKLAKQRESATDTTAKIVHTQKPQDPLRG
jgi:hypothetical protein